MNYEAEMGSEHTPRFYRHPTEEDIENDGLLIADLKARIRARILGSRATSAAIIASVGTLLTIQDHLYYGQDLKPIDLIYNFLIPGAVNGIAQLKVERQLRHTGEEMFQIFRNN